MQATCNRPARQPANATTAPRRLLLVICGLALACAAATAEKPAQPVDLVVVMKSERMLHLYRDGVPVRSYPIGLGDNPEGHKQRSGDQRTPEGAYRLDWRNPDSVFYKSIHVSYPDRDDRRATVRRGVDPGGEIMIHGQPNYAFEKRTGDWTDGCIAVSNKAMDDLWTNVPDDTPIHIYP